MQLENVGKHNYLGFIISRPIAHARVGRTVIAAPPSPANMLSKLLVRAKYEVHVLGATLEVEGAALGGVDKMIDA